MQFCITCARARLPREWSCPDCGEALYGPSVGAGRVPAPTPTGIVGVLGELTPLPPGKVAVLFGERGSGKSTVALQAIERPAVITTEMGPDRVAEYCGRLGVELVRSAAPELGDDGEWRWEHPCEGATGLVLDSLNGEGPGHVAAFMALARRLAVSLNLPAICVAQITVEGGVRGGEHAPHAADVVARIERSANGWRRLVVEKTRFGPERHTLFQLGGAAGLSQQLVGEYFYEVVGAEGRYRLEPYPFHRSEVWAAVEAEELPKQKPPVAAAARKAPLYGGWVEPPDHLARAAFCAALGVTYYSPTEGR
jgi:hypothetical protein